MHKFLQEESISRFLLLEIEGVVVGKDMSLVILKIITPNRAATLYC